MRIVVITMLFLGIASSRSIAQNIPESNNEALLLPIQYTATGSKRFPKFDQQIKRQLQKVQALKLVSSNRVRNNQAFKDYTTNGSCLGSSCVRALGLAANAEYAFWGHLVQTKSRQTLELAILHSRSGVILGFSQIIKTKIVQEDVALLVDDMVSQFESQVKQLKQVSYVEDIPAPESLKVVEVSANEVKLEFNQQTDFETSDYEVQACISREATGCFEFKAVQKAKGEAKSFAFKDLEPAMLYYVFLRNKKIASEKTEASSVVMIQQKTEPISITQPPVFSAKPGYYTDQVILSLESATEEADICYTVDESEPDCIEAYCSSGKAFTSELRLYENSTVKALSCRQGYANSSVQEAAYVVEAKNAKGLPRVAIMPFKREANTKRFERLNEKSSLLFEADLRSRNRFWLIEQKKVAGLEEFQAEQKANGCDDADCAMKMSKFLNCKYAIQGFLTMNEKGNSLEAILFDVESGNYLASTAVSGEVLSDAQIKQAVDILLERYDAEAKRLQAEKNSRFNPMYYNVLLPGIYDEKLAGPNYTFLGISVGSLSASIILGIAASNQVNTANAAKTNAEFSKAQTAVTISSIISAATIGYYLVNVFTITGRHKLFIPGEVESSPDDEASNASAWLLPPVNIAQGIDPYTNSSRTEFSFQVHF